MGKRTLPVEPPQFLSGWKEIANFLGKGVRTVQRYERELALPVRRPAGKDRGSVVAVRAELDGWVKATPIREAFPMRPPEYLSTTKGIKDGLAELARLRDQMMTLRFEMRQSLQRLQDNVYVLQGEMTQRQTYDPSSLYSHGERDLLDRTVPDITTMTGTHRKIS